MFLITKKGTKICRNIHRIKVTYGYLAFKL